MAITLRAILHKEKGKKTMTKFKKIFTLLAAFCLLVSVLASCASPKTETADSQQSTSDTSAEPCAAPAE